MGTEKNWSGLYSLHIKLLSRVSNPFGNMWCTLLNVLPINSSFYSTFKLNQAFEAVHSSLLSSSMDASPFLAIEMRKEDKPSLIYRLLPCRGFTFRRQVSSDGSVFVLWTSWLSDCLLACLIWWDSGTNVTESVSVENAIGAGRGLKIALYTFVCYTHPPAFLGSGSKEGHIMPCSLNCFVL